MKKSELITTGVAVISIVISITTAWLQFHDSYDLRASILNAQAAPGKITTTVALLNRGNRQSIVVEAVLTLYRPSSGLFITESDKIGPNALLSPISLNAGEVRIVTVSGDLFPDVVARHSFPSSKDLNEPAEASVLLVGILFRTATDSGTQYEARKHIARWVPNKGQPEIEQVNPKTFPLFAKRVSYL